MNHSYLTHWHRLTLQTNTAQLHITLFVAEFVTSDHILLPLCHNRLASTSWHII